MRLAMIILLIWLGGWVLAVLLYLIADGKFARLEGRPVRMNGVLLLVIFIMWPLSVIGSVCLLLLWHKNKGNFS